MKLAAEFVGVENMKEALLAIASKDIYEPSETHPPQ
jgi:hypothetical protein